MRPPKKNRWHEQISVSATREIWAAIDQLEADHHYDQQDFKAIDTFRNLERVSFLANELAAAISCLSPIAIAAVHELRGEEMGRYELRELSSRLRELEKRFGQAGGKLRTMHQPVSEGGQGANSSLGRESDAWAVTAEFDRINSGLAPFRSPKDKFGVNVLKVLAKHHRYRFRFDAYGATRCLQTFLEDVWLDVPQLVRTSHRAKPNWDRVIRSRQIIRELVRRDLRATHYRHAALRHQYGSFFGNRRRVREEARSY